MKELFELEEEVIRITADVKNKYEQDLSTTLTGMKTLPVCC
jgi:hypothetical protein